MRKEGKNSNIHWHPAFVEAIKMELKPYLDKIEILPEVPLTTEPLKIDCIIIKKTKNLVIKKNIGVIFRDWNIMEYKSPQDHVSINDFHKVYAYACLYSVINNVPVDNMTISFVESRYPKKLAEFLRKKRKYTVEKTSQGIYTVKGDIFAIQIVDGRHLSDDENLWLKSLSGKLDKNAISRVISEINKYYKTVNLEAYIDVVNRANAGIFKETIEMRAPTLKQMIMNTKIGAGWIKEWQAKATVEGRVKGIAEGRVKGIAEGRVKGIAEGKAKGIAEGRVKGMTEGRAEGETSARLKIARNLKSSGMSSKLIAKYTGLSVAKVRKI
ncbi:MAG: hypothetical protein LBV17_12325 [Treponema sp.]|jgi:hypothetical protein|nr:hypothetical protein [Treponema sp.]